MDGLRLEQRALLFDMLTNGTVDEATTRRLQQAIDTGNSAELFAIYNEHASEDPQTQLKTSASEGPQQGMSVSPDGDWKDALATSARNAGNNPNTTRVTGTQTTGTMPVSNRSGTKGGAYQNIANTDLTIAHDADWSDITAQAAARRRENLDFLQRDNGEVIGTQENVGEYELMFENIAKNADWMRVPDSPEYAARTAGAAFAIDPSEISDPSMRKQAQWGKGLSIAGGVGKFAMSGVKWGLDGYLEQKSQMDLLRERQKRQRKNLIGDGHEQVLAGGGEVYDAVELEKGEHILHPDGFVEEEEGVKHTQGGNVRTDLEPGTKVVTDQTKVGKDFAKKINDTFKDQGGSLNIKAKDTFATTIDKFKKKLGIQILEEEIKSITEAIKKQELVENKTTQNLNTMFLQSKLQEKVAEYEEAQETLSSYTEVIYQEQENRKKQQAEPEQTSFAKGGLVTTETIDAIATKNNISREQVISILNSYQADSGEGGKITVVDSGRNEFVKKATIQGMNPQDFATHVLNNKKDFSDDTIQQATFITNAKYPTVDSLAYEDVDNFDIKDVNVTPTQVSQLQKLGINTFEELKDYTDKSPENKEKAQDILGSRRLSQIINYHSDYELPEDSPEGTVKLEKLTDLGVVFMNIEDFQLTDEQVKGIQDLGIKDLKGIHTATPEQHEEIKKIIGNDTKHQAILDYSREVNANTEASAPINYTLDRIGGLAPEVTTTSGTLGGGSAGSNYEGPGAVESDEPIDTSRMEEQVSRAAQEAQKRLSMFDGNLPFSRPSLPVPETSQSVSYERLSIPEISDAENIKNIERAQQFAEERLRGMPSSQSRALLANITAGTQEALNKSFSTTMAHNAQGQLQEQQYNASRADMEMEKNKALAMDYERRMFTSLDTYDNNSRAYHQARYEWERNKQRDQSTANLIDSLSEAYTFTEDGKIQMEQKDFMDLFNVNVNGTPATQKTDKEKKNK